MNVEQFVMAYQVEQDRIRAMLPKGWESLRPVLRINAEIRRNGQKDQGETVYVEVNTPVAALGKRGWLNISNWESSQTDLTYAREEEAVTFRSSFLEITYTKVGIQGGCPAEKDNDGCFFIGQTVTFAPAESIDQKKEFCDCEFKWKFAKDNAYGISIGGKSIAAAPTEPKRNYAKQELLPQVAAAIKCQQILGAYAVQFQR